MLKMLQLAVFDVYSAAAQAARGASPLHQRQRAAQLVAARVQSRYIDRRRRRRHRRCRRRRRCFRGLRRVHVVNVVNFCVS